MYQFPPVPPLGLTLAIDREQASQLLSAQINKGSELARLTPQSPEQLDDLKRRNWAWVLETSDVLKHCFHSEGTALFFSSNVYVQPSVKLNDLERELEEFPPQIQGRVWRLHSILTVLPIVPEPPCGNFIAAQWHPRIYDACWRHFELADYGTAVSTVVSQLTEAVKEATVGSIPKTGAELMADAFNPEGYSIDSPGTSDGTTVVSSERLMSALVDQESTFADNQGVKELFTGFMHRYKNPAARAALALEECARILSLASYLMYIIDARKPQPEAQTYEFELLKDE